MLAGVPPHFASGSRRTPDERPRCRSGCPRLPGSDRRTCPAERGTECPDTCRGLQDPGPRAVTDPLRRWSASAPQRSRTGLPPAPGSDFRVLIMRPWPVLEPRSAYYLLRGTASQSSHRETCEAARRGLSTATFLRRERGIASPPVSRRCHSLTVCGSTLRPWSRGTAISVRGPVRGRRRECVPAGDPGGPNGRTSFRPPGGSWVAQPRRISSRTSRTPAAGHGA